MFTCLSTPSLGITVSMNCGAVELLKRIAFQLPLSGSPGASKQLSDAIIELLRFQLPLSGSPVERAVGISTAMLFQLPLSGSQADLTKICSWTSGHNDFFQLPLSGSPILLSFIAGFGANFQLPLSGSHAE